MKKHIYTTSKKALQPNVMKFTEANPFHGYQDIIKSLNKMQNELLPSGGTFEATKIPYTRSLYGDILQNPTTLSINDSQKMTYADGVVYSSLQYLAIMITGRIKAYRHKNDEIQAIVNHSFNNLKLGKKKFFRALMTALWAGFSANYLVWGRYKGKYIITDVIPMPPTSIIMSVDNAGTLKGYGGIMQYYYNTNLNGYANPFSYGGPAGEASFNTPIGDYPIPLRVPYINPMYLKPFHQKDILLYSIDGNDGPTNPYGRMMTRSVWQPYNYKYAYMQNMLIAATYKAAPLLLFYTDSTRPIQDTQGNVYSIADDINAKLTAYNGNGFMVINGKLGETVQHATVDNTADLDQFINGIELCNKEMRSGLLTAQTTFETEGNYATAVAHSSTQGRIIADLTDSVCEVLLTQFVRPIINYNWYEDDLGSFELQEQTLDEKLKVAKLLEFGYNFNVLCQDPTKKDLSLRDLNMARRIMEWETTDELFMNPSFGAAPGGATNFADTNRMTKTPHAEGMNQYGRKYDKEKGI